MRRLVSTIGLSKLDWLKYRKTGITGTDAGAIVGLNPYKSAFAVYQDKVTDAFEEPDNEAMRQGRDLEEYCATRFEEVTGKKVRRANAIYQNEKHPIMLADFDRLIVGEKAGLECKTVSPYSADKWADGNIPDQYQMQIQHYLAVSGYDAWYICALIFGRDFIITKVERDEELINNLILLEERFWTEHVMARVMPNPDGSETCSNLISDMYKDADSKKAVNLLGFNSDLKRREELIGLIDKMELEKNSIEQKIKLEMQDASFGETEEFRISWANFESRRLDTKRLKDEKPDVYAQYCKDANTRRFSVKRVA